MTTGSDHNAKNPLPRDVLPDSLPPSSAVVWDSKVRRIMAAADAELRRLGSAGPRPDVAWWSGIGLWRKPAAVFAVAAATALLFVMIGRLSVVRDVQPDVLTLGLVAADGDPVTLWGAAGIPADPVLALIAVQNPQGVTGVDPQPRAPKEEMR
jgi:hypothetical protein